MAGNIEETLHEKTTSPTQSMNDKSEDTQINDLTVEENLTRSTEVPPIFVSAETSGESMDNVTTQKDLLEEPTHEKKQELQSSILMFARDQTLPVALRIFARRLNSAGTHRVLTYSCLIELFNVKQNRELVTLNQQLESQTDAQQSSQDTTDNIEDILEIDIRSQDKVSKGLDSGIPPINLASLQTPISFTGVTPNSNTNPPVAHIAATRRMTCQPNQTVNNYPSSQGDDKDWNAGHGYSFNPPAVANDRNLTEKY